MNYAEVLATEIKAYEWKGFGRPPAERVANFYDLMDAAYDAKEIRTASANLGHIAIIDTNPRGGEKIPMEPAQAWRYNEHSASERIFAYLEN